MDTKHGLLDAKIQVEITDRDKQVLMDCCKYKGLTKDYFANRYFNGNIDACYARLYMLVKAGYLDKVAYTYKQKHKEEWPDVTPEINSKSNGQAEPQGMLKRGNKRTYIYFVRHLGQKAVNYNPALKAVKLAPNPNRLDRHILLSEIHSRIDNLLSASETRAMFNINNVVPVLCSVLTPDKLIVVTCLGKSDIGKTQNINNIKTFIKARAVNSKLPVVITLVSPFFPKELNTLNLNYLPSRYAPNLLSGLVKDTDHYKKSFRQVFINSGYAPSPDNGLFWQVSKGSRTYNIAELLTGSTELMRALHNPPPNTYIYAINVSHLPKTPAGNPFMVYSRKDNATYRVTLSSGSRNFEKIAKGVIT